jgi:hypothetical protein
VGGNTARKQMLDHLESQNRLRREMAAGEQLLWSGRPDDHGWIRPQDTFLVPFSIMWGGFAIFWEAGVLSSSSARSSVIFPLWGVLFVLIGLYLMVGRFFARRWIRRRTIYAVTDQRVIEIAPSWRRERATSMWLRSYPQVESRLADSGRGTLWIGSFGSMQRWVASEPAWPTLRSMTGGGIVLADIPDAASVYATIRRQLSGSASPTSS